jgi:hypothetical protein
MKRAFVLFQWIVFIALVGVFAWGVGRKAPPPDYDPASWNNWDGFCAISFSGVPPLRDSHYVNKEGLEEDFAALKQAGFHTIKPEDAAAFLAGRAPLPQNALLILFEGGRKDSFIAATPLLRKYGLVATYGVPAGLTEKWGSFYVRKGDVHRLAGDTHWSFASMGRNAMDLIRTSEEGEKKPFLTHRLWRGGRAENDAELRARIADDCKRASSMIEHEAGRKTVAYIAPYQIGGPWSDTDEATVRANVYSIEQHHEIAFMRHEGPFNPATTGPRNLTRLHVGGDLTGDELVKSLRGSMPRKEAVEGIHAAAREWITLGPARADGEKIVVGIRGRAWLQGTGGWSDLNVFARLHRDRSAIPAVYVRYTGPDAYLRVSMDSDTIRVQERLGARMQTLASQKIAHPDRTGNDVEIRAKGNRAWVTVDGDLIGGAPVPLTDATGCGAIGITSEGGNTTLTDFSAKPLASIFAFAQSAAQIPEAKRPAVTAILPVWYRAPEQAQLDDLQRRTAIIAGTGGIETIPIVEFSTNLNAVTADAYSRQIASTLEDPATQALVHRVALRGYAPELASALSRRGLGVVLILPPAEAQRIATAAAPALAGLSILIDAPEKNAAAESRAALEKLLHICSANRLIVTGGIARQLPFGVGTAVHFPESRR